MTRHSPLMGVTWGLGSSSFQKLKGDSSGEPGSSGALLLLSHLGPKRILRAPWTLPCNDSMKEVKEQKQRILEGDIPMAVCFKPPPNQTASLDKQANGGPERSWEF